MISARSPHRATPLRFPAMASVWCCWPCAALAACLCLSVAAVPAWGVSGVDVQLDTGRVTIEVDPNQTSFSELVADLAEDGFFDVEYQPELSGRAPTFTVGVNRVDDNTLLALGTVSGVKAARRLYKSPDTGSMIAQSNRLALIPKPGVTRADVEAVAEANNCQVVRSMGIKTTIYVARVRDELLGDAMKYASLLAASGLFEVANPDLYVERKFDQALGIEDPLYTFQWHLNNMGQTGGEVGADISAEDAWELTLGQGARIAVLDSAIDWRHPDLINSVVARYDFWDLDEDPAPERPEAFPICIAKCPEPGDEPNPDDPPIYCIVDPCQRSSCWGLDAHGTATAGLAVAQANNIGVRGVAPQGSLIAVRLGFTDIDIADSFYFADLNGAEVISNSWGFTNPRVLPAEVAAAIRDVSANGRNGRGVLIMFSSGNAAVPIRKDGRLALMRETMAVGATLNDDRLTCYSCFGPEQNIVAPGGGSDFPTLQSCVENDITTTDMRSFTLDPADFFESFFITGPAAFIPGLLCYGESSDDAPPLAGYNPPPPLDAGEAPSIYNNFDDVSYNRRFNGTSAACPIAAGVAGLVFSIDDTLTARQVWNILEHTADKVHPGDAGYDPVTGHSDSYGQGRVNAGRAVRAAINGRIWPSPVTDIVSSPITNQVRFTWTNPPADVASVMVVRYIGTPRWAPIDGREYVVGEQVDTNAIIVGNDAVEVFSEASAPEADLTYVIFVKNPISYYSWGRKVEIESRAIPENLAASVTASPSAGPAPLTVLFSGGGIDSLDRPIVSYAWNFGDQTTGVGPSITHTYDTPGNYLATLTIQNTAGQTAVATILIKVGQPSEGPQPDYSVILNADPIVGTAPLSVAFAAIVTPPTTLIESYEWEFGDGATETTDVGATSHTYAAPGNYNASVTAIDFLGARGTSSTVITVTSLDGEQASRDTDTVSAAPALCGGGVASAMVATMVLLGLMRFGARRVRRRDG
jgi:PKD repeat protein